MQVQVDVGLHARSQHAAARDHLAADQMPGRLMRADVAGWVGRQGNGRPISARSTQGVDLTGEAMQQPGQCRQIDHHHHPEQLLERCLSILVTQP